MSLFRESPVVLDHQLPLRLVRLPLEYQQPHTASTNNQQAFDDGFTRHGGFATVEHSMFQTISYRLTSDLSSLILTPLALKNALQLPHQRLRIELPRPLLNAGCYAIHSHAERLVVDMVIEGGVFVTVVVQLNDFVVGSVLLLEEFHTWGKCSVPYAFDHRFPILVRALSSTCLVIALNDGGLVRFSRENLLGDFSVDNFYDSSSSLVERLFGFQKEQAVSERAIIDVLLIGAQHVATLTLNKKLKIFNLRTLGLSYVKNINDYLSKAYHRTNLDLEHAISVQLLQVLEAETVQVAVLLPQIGNGAFFVLELSCEDEAVYLMDHKEVSTQLPASIATSEDSIANPGFSNIWVVQDYKFTLPIKSDYRHMFWVLWKSNTTSKIQYITVNTNDLVEYHDHFVGETDCLNFDTELVGDNYPEFYLDKFFNRSNYSTQVIETSLSVFSSFYNNGVAVEPHMSLRRRVRAALNANLSSALSTSRVYEKDVKNQCIKFDLLCQQFQKLARELIAMVVMPLSSIYILRGYDYSLVRPVDGSLEAAYVLQIYSELVAGAKDTGFQVSLVSFMKLLRALKRKLSTKTLKALRHKLLEETVDAVSDDAARIDAIYEEVFQEKLTQEFIQGVLAGLGGIQNLDQVLEFLVNPTLADVDDTPASRNTLGTWGSMMVYKQCSEFVQLHSSLVFEMLILMVIMDTNSETSMYYRKLVCLFLAYEMATQAMGLCFEDGKSAVLENAGPSSAVDSLFIRGFATRQDLTPANLSSGLSKLVFDHITNPCAVNYLVAELLSCQLPAVAITFAQYLTTSKVHQFLRGLLYYANGDALKFQAVFQNAAIHAYVPTHAELKSLRALSKTGASSLSLFNTTEVQYYHQLSQMAGQGGYTTAAIKFESLAQAKGEESPERSLRLFELTLEVGDFQSAYQHLTALHRAETHRDLVRRFVEMVLVKSEVKSLMRFPTTTDLLLFDGVLLDMAREQVNLKAALSYYKVLYSLRLSFEDYRGACEALYSFIARYDGNQSAVVPGIIELDAKKLNMVVTELYLVILNLLNTLGETTEKWLIKYDQEQNQLVTYSQLKAESTAWMNKLEAGL
ncbi:hypothetical protein BABINDRAFT_163885 [Babjeviella inositovora NRRL Y-12698]|uniref:Uncharacterized protein n=1 Tax=Babjeviella inositovora NRRL Y-12698 TaxID=984486 RepID=A0A1E3QH10_9ASCO|nr:uncharacterized protein BABINDRAFT_163885 [Babjeviella inositovora NRRL Y-12698]ODQ76979.1 hypothetical protein BABINDRAFT_163885 [Babjeviella inositovora NRRL Y-12698]